MGTDDLGKPSSYKCDFCKTPGENRAQTFCNETLDFRICDVCVLALHGVVEMTWALKGNPYQQRHNERTN